MTKEEALAALAGIHTPIVCDAVEKYDLRPRTDGLMVTSIRSLLRGLGPMVGYATTAKIAGEYPAAEVGSLLVYPGDLLHGHEPGVMVIPSEIELTELVTFIAKFLASEKTVIDYCKGPDCEVDQLMALIQQHAERTERR